jgi:hypothetical protein
MRHEVPPLLSVHRLRQLLDEVLLWQVYDLDQHDLERHVQQLFFELSQDKDRCLEDRFPSVLQLLEKVSTYDKEIVPDAKELPH